MRIDLKAIGSKARSLFSLQHILGLTRKIRGVFRFRYRHKSPHVVQVQF